MLKQSSSYLLLVAIVLFIFFGDKLPFDFIEVGLLVFVVFIITKAIENKSKVGKLSSNQKLLIGGCTLLLIAVTAGVLGLINILLLFFEIKLLANFIIASILFVIWCLVSLRVLEKVLKGLKVIV